MLVITIIGYKPNGVDSVMGCVQDRVDSDFMYERFINDMDSAADLYAKMYTEEPYSEFMNHEWEEIVVLFNGLDRDDYGWDELWENRDPIAVAEVNAFFELTEKKIQEIRDNRIKEAERKKKKAETQKKRKAAYAAKKKEKDELAEYERLKEKYEG